MATKQAGRRDRTVPGSGTTRSSSGAPTADAIAAVIDRLPVEAALVDASGRIVAASRARDLPIGTDLVACHRDPSTLRRMLEVGADAVETRLTIAGTVVRARFGAAAPAGERFVVWETADDRDAEARQVIGVVATAADGLDGISTSLSAAAAEASLEAGMVARAVEEMTVSIAEISARTADATAVAADAVAVTRSATAILTELTDAAEQIGTVVGLIARVTAQTNLLALNATIEAARAGDAGRGFAVVANEVKALAQQTSSATVEITRTVDSIRSGAHTSMTAMQEIDAVIDRVATTQTAVAAAVEEQSAAATEISRNVGAVASAAAATARDADRVRDTAASLVQQTGPLRELLLSAEATLGEQLTGAIAAHEAWRSRLRSAIETGTADIDVAQASRDDGCRFGQWLTSPSAARLSADARFAAVRSHHADFHRAAGGVLAAALAGRPDDARQQMAPGLAYATASEALVQICRDWLRDVS